jgi:hypothetical protein
MVSFFTLLWVFGMASFAVFMLENIHGRISTRTRWSDLTVDQWVLVIGSLCTPIGFVGMLFAR